MAEEPQSGCSFTIEEMCADDPRLRQFLEIPEEAKQSSFHATIQLLPGPDELEIENVTLWNQFHLTDEDFSRLQSLGLKGKLRVTGWGEFRLRPLQGSDSHCSSTPNTRGS